MEHETVAPLLSDLMTAQLDAARASSAWAHVAACDGCQAVLKAMRQVRDAIAAEGEAVFSAHPSSDDIVRFALADPELPTHVLARIGTHLRLCGSCRAEVDLTRRADSGAPEWWRPFWSPIEALGSALVRLTVPSAWSRLAPALAALVLVLAYPAYQGAVRLPAATRATERAQQEAGALRSEQQGLKSALGKSREELQRFSSWGGGARLLYLSGPTRGESSAPRVSLGEGQPYQPIVVDWRPGTIDAGGPPHGVEVRLVGRVDRTPVWKHQAPVSDLWDPAQQALVLLVPTALLEPGDYRLEVQESGHRVVGFVGGFTVVARGAR